MSRNSLFISLLLVPTLLTSFDHHNSLPSSHFLLRAKFKYKMSFCKSMGTNLRRQTENVPRERIKLLTPLHANHTFGCTPLLWIGSHMSRIRLFISLLYVYTNLTSIDHQKTLLRSHFLLIVMFKCKMSSCKSMWTNIGMQIETVLRKKKMFFTPLHANHTLVCTPLLWICTNISRSYLLFLLLYVHDNLTSIDHPKSLLSSPFLLRAKFKCKMSWCKSMGNNLGRQSECVPRNKIKLFTPLHANHTLGCTPLLWIGSHMSRIRLFISLLYVYTNLTSIDHPKSILSSHFFLRAKFKNKMSCCKSMGANFEWQIKTMPQNKIMLSHLITRITHLYVHHYSVYAQI